MPVLERPVICIPYRPREWAKKLHSSYKRFIVKIIHRRGGKTTFDLNHHQRAATDDQWETNRLRYLSPNISDSDLKALLKRRTYWHVMPTYHQAKITGAWDLLQEISRPIPGIKANQSEMSIVYPNGHRLQLVGGDNPDALRGGPLSGASLDEYSQIHPAAFGEVLSKSLADHMGYAIFSGTIKGMDQLYRLYQSSKDNPEWEALWQDIDTSLATEKGGTITALLKALGDDRKLVLQGVITQAEFDQEWYLSPEAAIKGSFYGDILKELRNKGQICRVPYDPMLPVDTDWDLGIDAMAIWFSQSTRSGEIRLIDYYENVGGGLDLAIKEVKNKPYTYGKHWGPHDIQTREISSGKTRRQIAFDLGITFDVTPKLEVAEGITAAQLVLPRCWFEEEKTKHGLEALRHYRRTYQQRLDFFTETPVHDAASHGSDAFRGLSVRYRLPVIQREKTALHRQYKSGGRATSYMG